MPKRTNKEAALDDDSISSSNKSTRVDTSADSTPSNDSTSVRRSARVKSVSTTTPKNNTKVSVKKETKKKTVSSSSSKKEKPAKEITTTSTTTIVSKPVDDTKSEKAPSDSARLLIESRYVYI